MFECSTCGRSYASRGSLSRHERNHRQDKRVTCPECNVSFRRGDLLARHLQIHRGSDIQSRRRCHTACDNCRALRSKCDGGQPCATCSQAVRSCVYSRMSSRVSEQEVVSPQSLPHQSPHDGASEPSNEPVASNSMTWPETSSGANEYMYSSPPTAAGISPPTINLNISGPESSDRFDLRGDMFRPMGPPPRTSAEMTNDNFWGFPTAWQFTHEDLYLQGSGLQPMDTDLSDYSSMSVPYVYNASQNGLSPDMSEGLQFARGTSSLSPPTYTSEPAQQTTGRNSGSTQRQSHSKQTLRDTVDGILNFAVSKDVDSPSQPNSQWQAWSLRLSRFINIRRSDDSFVDGAGLLDYTVDQYFVNFHGLWPMLNDWPTRGEWHPLLYLTLSSIGALYSGTTAAAKYGSVIHTRLRNVLAHHPIRNDQRETEALDVGRAMLLTQVAALYFEQKGAFSAAQTLGAALTAYAHRIRLFTVRPVASHLQSGGASGMEAVLAEGRRMLAFGILRGESFMSVLFNRKPLLSYEEVNLPLPFGGLRPEASLRPTEQKGGLPYGGTLFSDLVRIALDTQEVLPVLRPSDLELLLFGLQHDVWRFCHDPDIFMRLISKRRPDAINYPIDSTAIQPSADLDLLDHRSREMRGLANDYERIVRALNKWNYSMTQSQHSYPLDQHRSAYLSGLILQELSFLRLSAPVEAIQQLAYQFQDLSASDEVFLDQVTEWSRFPEASEAFKHAQGIFLLIRRETSREKHKQARYNILALMALHHAAAVVWAVVGTETLQNQHFIGFSQVSSTEEENLPLRIANTRKILLQFAELFRNITTAWGMQSSYYKMVKKLAEHPFPRKTTLRISPNHSITAGDALHVNGQGSSDAMKTL